MADDKKVYKVVYPTDIFNAVEKCENEITKERKKEIDKICEKYGCKKPEKYAYAELFRINYNTKPKKETQSLIKLKPWEFKTEDGWTPMTQLALFNVELQGSIKPPEVRAESQMPTVSIALRLSSICSRKVAGNMITEKMPFKIINDAFKWHAELGLAQKKLVNSNKTIIAPIKDFNIKDGAEEIVDDPYINFKIQFKTGSDKKSIESNALPLCDILDIERKKTAPITAWPYENAKLKDENGEYTIPIMYSNIHKFITYGSVVNMHVNLGSICLSSMGISLPFKVRWMIVKHKEFSPNISNISTDDWDSIGAIVGNDDGKEIKVEDKKIIKKEVKKTIDLTGIGDDGLDDDEEKPKKPEKPEKKSAKKVVDSDEDEDEDEDEDKKPKKQVKKPVKKAFDSDEDDDEDEKPKKPVKKPVKKAVDSDEDEDEKPKKPVKKPIKKDEAKKPVAKKPVKKDDDIDDIDIDDFDE